MMSFEDTLRRQLHEQAGAIPLPPRLPEGAAQRAHARRNHRLAVAGAAAAVVLAGAAAVAIPGMGSDGNDPVSMAGPGLAGLPAVGPIELDWQATDGGVTPYAARTFQDADGVVYALSTAPGPAGDEEAAARALYRLGDDGTWAPVVLDDGLRLADAAATGGLLYGVSTAPAAGGEAPVARLSTSADGGETWSTEDLPAPPPPSDGHPWQAQQTAAVESLGGTTLALVTTAFLPDHAQLFPELAGDGNHVVEERPEGLALMRLGSAGGSEDPSAPATTLPGVEPADAAEDVAAGRVSPSGEPTEGPMEEVRVVPWADLGIDGPDQLRPTTQVFRTTGDGWEPVEADLGAFDSMDLQATTDQFVASGYDDVGGNHTYRSADGTTWAEVSGPGEGAVVAAGPALVWLPMEVEGTPVDGLQASADGGATWQPVEVTGVGDGELVIGYDGGPLGLALVLGSEDGVARQLAVTGDLASWTATPIAELDGGMVADGGVIQPYVGADRIVLKVAEADLASEGPPASRTVVGTPRR